MLHADARAEILQSSGVQRGKGGSAGVAVRAPFVDGPQVHVVQMRRELLDDIHRQLEIGSPRRSANFRFQRASLVMTGSLCLDI